MRKRNVIIAPHMDDELIGCWEIIDKYPSACYVIFTNADVDDLPSNYKKNIWMKSWAELSYSFMFSSSIPKKLLNNKKECRFYFPDPVYEFHPDHRKQGAIGEQLLRKGHDIIFYNINMQAPYIHKVKDSDMKRTDLEYAYEDKRRLWEYDHKYFLFEGRVKWMV